MNYDRKFESIHLLQTTASGFIIYKLLKNYSWDFPSGPVVKTSPSNAWDANSIPGQGTKIQHAAEQLTHMPELESAHTISESTL